jgi:RimJ/RimL family protein N-acetyltransferase
MSDLYLKDRATINRGQAKGIKLRLLTDSDRDALLEFYLSLNAETVKFFHPWEFTLEAIQKHFQAVMVRDHISVVAENEEGKIIGHAFIQGIKTKNPSFGIGLRENYRGIGLGKKLMSYVLSKARSLRRITLTVIKENIKGRALYEKFGFKVAGQTKDSWKMEIDRDE